MVVGKFVSVDEIKSSLEKEGLVCLKYVRTQQGYKFLLVDMWCPNHNQMVDVNEGVISAGYINICREFIDLEGWSSSLQIGSADDDHSNFEKMFLIR